jgi:hypothetical protein
VIVVSFTTDKPVQATPPMVTAEAPVKPAPDIVIDWPPASDPELGETELTTGMIAV